MRRLVIAVIILVIPAFISCKNEKEKKEIIRSVKTVIVGDIQQLIDNQFPGVTQELKSVEMAFRVGGPLVYLKATEGMAVKKGQLIAEIDSRDYKVDLTAKEARNIQARAEKERFERLLAKKSVSKNEYDQRLAASLEAQSAFDAAKNALADTKLKAPFSAFIDQKYVENFERVQIGQPIVTLLDLSAIEVKFTVPELLATQFRQFKDFNVFFDIYPDVPFKANFKGIEKKSESSAGIPITLVLEHKNSNNLEYQIIPGVACKVKVNLEEEVSSADDIAAISVPVTAVFEKPDGENRYVFVVNKDSATVSLREVEVGTMVSTNLIWITDGIKQGETLVTAGANRLQDGQKVKILN